MCTPANKKSIGNFRLKKATDPQLSHLVGQWKGLPLSSSTDLWGRLAIRSSSSVNPPSAPVGILWTAGIERVAILTNRQGEALYPNGGFPFALVREHVAQRIQSGEELRVILAAKTRRGLLLTPWPHCQAEHLQPELSGRIYIAYACGKSVHSC